MYVSLAVSDRLATSACDIRRRSFPVVLLLWCVVFVSPLHHPAAKKKYSKNRNA